MAVGETRKLPGLVSTSHPVSGVRVGITQLLVQRIKYLYLIREREYSVSVGFL